MLRNKSNATLIAWTTWHAVVVLALLVSFSANAEEKAPDLTFDHASVEQAGKTYELSVDGNEGQPMVLEIQNTCGEYFTYEREEIELAQSAPTPTDPNAAPDPCPTKTVRVDFTFTERLAGYVVHLREKVDPNNPYPGDLDEATLILHFERDGWSFQVAGGFTITNLTDPKFALEERDGESILVRDRGAEDKQRLGIAALSHIYHLKHPNWAGTFGLGINQDNKTSYFTGISYRFGNTAALTLGYNWASVTERPAGVKLGQAVPANTLSNLGSKTDGDFFLAISLSFLGADNAVNAFKKPFEPLPEDDASDE